MPGLPLIEKFLPETIVKEIMSRVVLQPVTAAMLMGLAMVPRSAPNKFRHVVQQRGACMRLELLQRLELGELSNWARVTPRRASQTNLHTTLPDVQVIVTGRFTCEFGSLGRWSASVAAASGRPRKVAAIALRRRALFR